MPSRETADLLFFLKKRDFKQIKHLLKLSLRSEYYRGILWKDTIATKFWKKVPHDHKIMTFEDEGYCFCTRCHKSWTLEDFQIIERDRKLSQILKK